MTLPRRLLLVSAAALPFASPALTRAQGGNTTDSAASAKLTLRAMGNPDAKVRVDEYFSLTCTHCAAFQRETFPQVKKNLIDTGKVFYQWHDFPLDQVALTAAVVARALPPDRYEPFINVLLTTQDKWAFARDVNSTEELGKVAALAGMPRSTFDQAVSDGSMRRAIVEAQDEAQKQHDVNSTPTFLINGKPLVGAVDYATFLKAVDAATS
jgi:protein-disulfide isomerase